jgi:hypothetical protein
MTSLFTTNHTTSVAKISEYTVKLFTNDTSSVESDKLLISKPTSTVVKGVVTELSLPQIALPTSTVSPSLNQSNTTQATNC